MAYGTPTDPVAGTVITVAYAVANLLDPIRQLRANTGGSDPPGSNYWLKSTSTAGASWVTRATEVLAALGFTPVNKAGDMLTGELVQSGGFGYSLGATSGTKGRLYDVTAQQTVLSVHNDIFGIWKSDLSQNLALFTSALATFSGGISAIAGSFSGVLSGASASIGGAGAFGGNVTVGGTLDVTGAMSGPGTVPLGGVIWFETLAELTAAGAAWARYTAADGRLLVGAGTTFSQTFAEATNYGSNWTPAVGVSVNDTIGISDTVSWSAAGVSPPNAGTLVSSANPGATTYALNTHTHPGPTLSKSGSVTKTGSAAIAGAGSGWLPPTRAGIWGRRVA